MLSSLLLIASGLCFQVNSWRVDKVPRRLHTLIRRQCEWNDKDQGYTDCDFNLPTLEQLVERIHDTDNYGLGDAQHHALFYTNLDDPGITQGTSEPWPHGWMKNEKLKYYWVEDALDWNCKDKSA